METSYPLDKIRVALFEGVHPAAADRLGAAGYTVEVLPGSPTDDQLARAAAEAHMVGIRSKTQLGRAFFEGAAHVWAVGCFCIGTNQVDLAAAAETGVAVFNAPFSNTRSVAEKTICEVIALHRKLFDRSRAMHEGRWMKKAVGAHEVRGRTLGIVGYGRIGSQLSVLAEALGMRVVYHDVNKVLPLGNAQEMASLDRLLAESDVVSLHVPATASTARLIGAREIARMRPGAMLINNARGSVVDVDALAAAIREGRLAGASVDVFPEEPRESDAGIDPPLRGLDNVILTPHIGGSTMEAQESIAHEVSEKLIRLMNTGATTMAVNLPEVDLPVLHEKRHRVLHYHRNVPGVLSKMHRIISEMGVNVAAEYLQSDPKHSYVILDVDADHGEELKRRLRDEVEETIRIRSIW